MSTDYYARLERGTGPHPSEQLTAAIARGLHLSLDERDHLFRLAGHHPPDRGPTSDHVGPGLQRILDRLDDTPAEVISELGETLLQTRMGRLLLGDAALRVGPERSIGYRWFTDPAARDAYPPEEQEQLARLYASGLRELVALRGPSSRAARMVQELAEHAEFRRVWDRHEVGLLPPEVKRFRHPDVGELELSCQTLVDPEQSHRLLVYTAVPGSASHEKLQLLSVIGDASYSEA